MHALNQRKAHPFLERRRIQQITFEPAPLWNLPLSPRHPRPTCHSVARQFIAPANISDAPVCDTRRRLTDFDESGLGLLDYWGDLCFRIDLAEAELEDIPMHFLAQPTVCWRFLLGLAPDFPGVQARLDEVQLLLETEAILGILV